MVLLSFDAAVDIGYGRGRLAGPAAASLRRIDAQLGRPADVNEAWRSPQKADENYRKWVAYQNGTGPAAPYALPASQSIHCRGYAVDSDDWYNAHAAAVWRANGWRQTARYPGTSRDEIWHGEYFTHLDQFLGQTAGSGASPFEEDDMFTEEDRNRQKNIENLLAVHGAGYGYPQVIAQRVDAIHGRILPAGQPWDNFQLLESLMRQTLAAVISDADSAEVTAAIDAMRTDLAATFQQQFEELGVALRAEIVAGLADGDITQEDVAASIDDALSKLRISVASEPTS